MIRSLLFLGLALSTLAAEPDFPLTADSQPQASVPKGEIIKGSYTARDGSVFPGTVRDYQIYLPAGLDQTQPAAFMVFQDGVIYQAPVVFDNLLAKKDIPPLVGIFIKPGIVPAANENALPRFNRSYEYDSITPTYSDFLIDEFLPAIESKHSLKLSTDPNHAAISGNSSGGICALMVAWHRPDRFRRVFTGVGTYVGIHGADQLPVLVRKFEPKPLRIFLQSGTGDNNLYCGDWWMANQMMERSLTWAGYDVNHAWGEGGHNAKHATQIFPEVLRWLWRDWKTTMEIKANPKNESKWKGYEVVGAGEWEPLKARFEMAYLLTASSDGTVYSAQFVGTESFANPYEPKQVEPAGIRWNRLKDSKLTVTSLVKVDTTDSIWYSDFKSNHSVFSATPHIDIMASADGLVMLSKIRNGEYCILKCDERSTKVIPISHADPRSICMSFDGTIYISGGPGIWSLVGDVEKPLRVILVKDASVISPPSELKRQTLMMSPDQTHFYVADSKQTSVLMSSVDIAGNNVPFEQFHPLDGAAIRKINPCGLCVDTNGWLYVATSLGIQVLDQAGRVNFILPTPKPALDVCFGGKDLSDLFIACGDTIYKRPTKAKGIVSGQQPPIKPPAPKL